MPNWCHNKLTIEGDPTAVEKCVAGIAEPEQESHPGGGETQPEPVAVENRSTQPLDFNQIVPVPVELREALEDPRRAAQASWDALEWFLPHWGTMRNAVFDGGFMALAVDMEVEVPRARTPIVGSGNAFYAFETAWSPPVPVITALASAHATLDFELVWGELGAGVAGRVIWRGGELHSDEEIALEEALSPKEMWF